MRQVTGFAPERLLAPDDAIAAYRERVALAPPGEERVSLDGAAGRILAADAIARDPFPADARSTMDGYAVRSADGPGLRRLAGEVVMGHAPPGPLAPGEVMAIPTGGVLPPGADAVVPIEETRRERDGVVVPGIAPGTFVTPRGDDMRAGDVVLRAGRRIGAAELGVLATLGIADVPVYRRPRLALISTGDELVDADAHPATGQVRDSNRWAIAGLLAARGIEPVQCPRVADTPAELRDALASALAVADGAILSGGSSVGLRDHVPEIVAELGEPGVVVHGLRVKPGKPTVLGAVGHQPVFGLPGNPTSALTIAAAILGPLLDDLTGERDRQPAGTTAVAGEAFSGRPGWTWYVPAVLERGRTTAAFPLALRSSHVSLLARADGYVVVGPDDPHIEAGATVTVVPLGAA